MKKLIGIFDTKRMTPEQIYKKAKKAIQENERLDILTMAKNRKERKS